MMMMKSKKRRRSKQKCSRSLMPKLLDWFGFRLKPNWQLVWKSNGHLVFFVRRYDVQPFRRYEICFSEEKTKPKKSFTNCFAEFLGSVEMFELEDDVDDGWLENPFFGCKSLEEMMVKLDLLGENRKKKKESYGDK